MNKARAIEHVVRAKVLLEQKKPATRRHSDSCPVDYDSDYYGPCKCGADAANSRAYGMFEDVLKSLNDALDELAS